MMRGRLAQRVLVVLVLALGIGVAWGVFIAIGCSIFTTLRPIAARTSEDVVVVADGTPLIRSRSGGNYLDTSLRTLSGKTIELERQGFLTAASLAEPYRAPRLVEGPITWRQRLAGCSNHTKPPANWVLVRDDLRPGRAYFVGYDSFSKLRIGYLGRDGFRVALPPVDDWFDLGQETLGWGSRAVTSASQVYFGTAASYYSGAASARENKLGPWLVYLKDGKTIQEINLRERQVRALGSFAGLQAMGIGEQPLAGDDEQTDDELEETPSVNTWMLLPTQSDNRRIPPRSPFQLTAMQPSFFYTITPAEPINPKHKTAHRLLFRCDDRIVRINPFDGTRKEFFLPESLLNQRLTVYCAGEDQLLLQYGRGWWERGSVVGLLWIDPAGEVTRDETLQLAGYVGGSQHAASLGAAVVAPTLLPWLGGLLGAAPLAQLHSYQAETYAEALSKTFDQGWPGLLLVSLLSILLAAVVFRWHGKYGRPNRAAWTSLVLLTTLPGFLAYWVLHRRPPLAACPGCGRSVPRNRDGCARCDQPFPEPTLLGTEVFA